MVDINSKEYKLWKERHNNSYFEEHYNSSFLYYEKYIGHKVIVDNIAIKDFGETNYISWTENHGETTELFINETTKPAIGNFNWTISPTKGSCFFWVNKWTEDALYIVLNNSVTNYALRLSILKNPLEIHMDFSELSTMLVIKRNWIIGYKFYTDTDVNIFDLKSFSRKEKLTEKIAFEKNIVPTEQGENDEELE